MLLAGLMRFEAVIVAAAASVVLGVTGTSAVPQAPAVTVIDEKVLREYAGVYPY